MAVGDAMKTKKITINDVAEACGVNVSTVSRVINDDPRISEETKQKVQVAIDALGYKPLRKRQNGNKEILLAIPNTSIYTIGATLDYLSKNLNEKDYDIRIVNLKHERTITPAIAEKLCKKAPSGIILYGCYVPKSAADVFYKYNVPTIVRHGETQHLISVCVNNYNGIQEAVRFVIAQGYKKIGFIGWEPVDHNTRTRYNSFVNALSDAGLDSSMVINHTLDIQGGYQSTKEMLERHKPEAIIYGADILAYGAIQYFREENITYPEDIGIIGFDDSIPSAALGLTTMYELIEETAELVMDNLLMMIQQKKLLPPREILLTPKLIIRDSIKLKNE